MTMNASNSSTPRCFRSEGPISATGTATTAAPSHTSTPGWCTFHTTQFKRNEAVNPSSNFKLDFRIFNAADALIATLYDIEAASGHTVSIATLLPDVLNVTAQTADNDPLQFEYNGAFWNSSDSRHCKFGGYSATQRQGDCGFTC